MISQGNQAGLSAELAGGVIMIGRGADCQLILDDDYVSTRHARVVSTPNGIYVEDLGSTNGTYVNGQRSLRRRRSRLPTRYASARPC